MLELDEINVPFLPADKKKKDFRRAGYFVARIGSTVKDTELFTFGREVTELRIPTKLLFANIGPDFTLFVEFFGMELAVKEKLSSGMITRSPTEMITHLDSAAKRKVHQMGPCRVENERYDQSNSNSDARGNEVGAKDSSDLRNIRLSSIQHHSSVL